MFSWKILASPEIIDVFVVEVFVVVVEVFVVVVEVFVVVVYVFVEVALDILTACVLYGFLTNVVKALIVVDSVFVV